MDFRPKSQRRVAARPQAWLNPQETPCMGQLRRDGTQQDQPVPLFHPPSHTCGHTRVSKEEPLGAYKTGASWLAPDEIQIVVLLLPLCLHLQGDTEHRSDSQGWGKADEHFHAFPSSKRPSVQSSPLFSEVFLTFRTWNYSISVFIYI